MYKQPQLTCQADTVTDSSLTQSVALLVHPRGTTHSIVDCHVFTGSQKGYRPKQTIVLPIVCLDSARVWLSCQAISRILPGFCKFQSQMLKSWHAKNKPSYLQLQGLKFILYYSPLIWISQQLIKAAIIKKVQTYNRILVAFLLAQYWMLLLLRMFALLYSVWDSAYIMILIKVFSKIIKVKRY